MCIRDRYNTNQTAVSTIHMPVNDYLVPLWLVLWQTQSFGHHAVIAVLISYCLLNTIIDIIIECWDFSWSLLCFTLVSVFVLGIGIAIGQYYWVLDIGCLSWYRSNPNADRSKDFTNKAQNSEKHNEACRRIIVTMMVSQHSENNILSLLHYSWHFLNVWHFLSCLVHLHRKCEH